MYEWPQGTVVQILDLSHYTIRTVTVPVLRFFFNMPKTIRNAFLSCPIVFKDDLLGLVRTSHSQAGLSILHDEASIFNMDFAANRRRLVNVLFLYYIRNNFRSCAVALHARTLQVCLAMTTFCTLRKFDDNSLPKRQMITTSFALKFTKTTLWLFPLCQWQVRSTDF